MITDEERRNVAANIRSAAERRKYDLQDDPDYDPFAALYCVFCGVRGFPRYKDLLHLAELIEPEPERTCQMDKSEFADFAPEYEGLYSCTKCGEETAVLACVNEDGDMEWMKPRFCGFCGAKVVEVVDE